jgi:hypothetical protein
MRRTIFNAYLTLLNASVCMKHTVIEGTNERAMFLFQATINACVRVVVCHTSSIRRCAL